MTAYSITTHLQPGLWWPGMKYKALSNYALTGAVVTADTFNFVNMLPSNGIKILGGTVWGAELDTNASPTATIIAGDADDTDGFVTSKVWGSANQQFFLKFDGAYVGTSTPTSRDLLLTLGGTVATAASSGTIWVEIEYLCNAQA